MEIHPLETTTNNPHILNTILTNPDIAANTTLTIYFCKQTIRLDTIIS